MPNTKQEHLKPKHRAWLPWEELPKSKKVPNTRSPLHDQWQQKEKQLKKERGSREQNP